ncbi:hypothetical protein C1645_811159 [Glomus cerebriforme]|uniref:Uncharacterized protein n=1 Tax=Glomus cerebriforme TaxID=658196 RepID=A0A397TNV8_9GLOM|nr:hypothetical protein C1645_811159 [Glomus cerebriforme]
MLSLSSVVRSSNPQKEDEEGYLNNVNNQEADNQDVSSQEEDEKGYLNHKYAVKFYKNFLSLNTLLKMEVIVSTYLDKLFNEYIHPIEYKNIGSKSQTNFDNLLNKYNLWKDVKNKDGSVNNVGQFVKGVSDYTTIPPTVLFLIGKIISKFYKDILDANIRSLDEPQIIGLQPTIPSSKYKVQDLEQPILATSSRSTSTKNTNSNMLSTLIIIQEVQHKSLSQEIPLQDDDHIKIKKDISKSVTSLPENSLQK